MRRFVEGVDRGQTTLFPERMEDWIGEDNPSRVVDVFVEELDLAELGFGGVDPEATGRPSYHPSILLKLYIYGYLNRVQSSRRLEYEAGRNVEVMWLLNHNDCSYSSPLGFKPFALAESLMFGLLPLFKAGERLLILDSESGNVHLESLPPPNHLRRTRRDGHR